MKNCSYTTFYLCGLSLPTVLLCLLVLMHDKLLNKHEEQKLNLFKKARYKNLFTIYRITLPLIL